jgi:hypothetical protein
VPAKTYLVYCRFDNPSDTEDFHYHFEYLIQAVSADDAEAKCGERFAKLPTDGELFEAGARVYVDGIVEIGAVPTEGALLRWVRYRGEGDAIYTSLPLGDGGGTLASFTTDDPDQEVSELEPFVVIGESRVNVQ